MKQVPVVVPLLLWHMTHILPEQQVVKHIILLPNA